MEPPLHTLTGETPMGFAGSIRSDRIGPASVFETVADELLRWGLQRESGIRLIDPVPVVTVGAPLTAKVRGLPVTIRCTVIAVVDEPARKGFVIETLPGHALEGQEAFIVERVDEATEFTVSEYSRPQSWLARLPGARLIQRRVLGRYVPAARRMAERAAAQGA